MQKVSRRDALRGTGVAAIAAGAAMMPLGAKAGGVGPETDVGAADGELAKLIRLYFRQCDEFNTTPHPTDEEFDAHAASTFQATLGRMYGVPVRTADDAVALVDWLEGEELVEDFIGDLDGMVPNFLASLRRYIAKEARP
jgi:hypothetical protein